MSRFRGLQVQTSGGSHTLKEQLSEGGYSFIYSTSQPQLICKVQVVSQPQIQRSFQSEKYLLSTLQHRNIIRLVQSAEVTVKGDKLGLLFLENCPRGNLLAMMERLRNQPPEEKTVLKIMLHVLSALELLHVNGVSHRDIKLENILEGVDGEFKLCDFGSATGRTVTPNNDNRHAIEQDIEKHTTPMYRSPQQLNLYSGYEIGPKVDVFALGCAMFMLCFRKPPFQSRLSSINNQYFIPEGTQYSEFVISLICKCFTPDPKQRPSAADLIKQIHQHAAQVQMLELERCYRQALHELANLPTTQRQETEQVSTNFVEKVRRLYHQITTKTEGWILGFIEQNEQAPLMKYNRFLISKCWEKRYKVEKVYQVIEQEVQQYTGKSLVVLKILVLLHDFLRKGPPECISNSYKINASTICQKLLTTWRGLSRTDRAFDQKRHPFVCLVIELYSVLLLWKVRLGFTYAFFIEGNFSLLPFFRTGIEGRILSLSFVEELISYLERLVSFHDRIQSHSYLVDIQRSIILSLIDEEYCLVSVLVHIYIAFKHATNYIEEVLDDDALRYKLAQTDSRFEAVYLHLRQLFEQARKFSTLLGGNNFELDVKLVDYLKSIQVLQKRKNFNIRNHLNYEISHFGLRIPMTYEEISRNNQSIESMVQQAEKNFKSDGSSFLEIDPFRKKQNKPMLSQKDIQSPRSKPVNAGNTDANFEKFNFEEVKKQPSCKNPFESLAPNLQIMEFTHQNLNKNIVGKNGEKDKFKEFLSFASLSSNQNFQESIHPVKQLDFSYFEEAKPEQEGPKSPRQLKKPEVKAPQNKAENYLDLRYFIVGEVTKNADQYLLNYSELEFTKIVGTGHSSEVYLGKWRGQQVAIKKIMNRKNNQQFQREIITCMKLRPHMNLVSLIGVAENMNQLYIISEYCYGGTLFSLLHQSKALLSWQNKVEIAKQIAQGMLFLHTSSPPIIHRDLKSLNVLISYPYRNISDRLHIKIADFGLSREVSMTFMTGVLGTFHWMAPEIFNNERYTLQADTFSYGIVLWEIMTRQTPYKNMDSPQALMKYVTMEGGRPDLKLVPQECPPPFKALMIKCWDQDPSKRPDFKMILQLLNQLKV